MCFFQGGEDRIRREKGVSKNVSWGVIVCVCVCVIKEVSPFLWSSVDCDFIRSPGTGTVSCDITRSAQGSLAVPWGSAPDTSDVTPLSSFQSGTFDVYALWLCKGKGQPRWRVAAKAMNSMGQYLCSVSLGKVQNTHDRECEREGFWLTCFKVGDVSWFVAVC